MINRKERKVRKDIYRNDLRRIKSILCVLCELGGKIFESIIMNPKNGKRKFTAFIITITCFTAIVIFCLSRIDISRLDLSTFAVQLATGYSVVCGLFFGSNVLEHFASKNDKDKDV